MKALTQFAVAACLACFFPGHPIFAQNSPEPDFRKAVWGMSQQQVMATEAGQPVEVRRENGEVVVKYDPVRTGDLAGRLIFIFANDKLVRAKYLSDAEHVDLNDFIVDFRAVEPTLMEKYGQPVKQRAVWENDLFQQERLTYLDQDRALPADILPSDQNAGLAISLGYLRLITQRGNARTKVIHTLTGEDHRIFHQVEYRSVELEGLENKLLERN